MGKSKSEKRADDLYWLSFRLGKYEEARMWLMAELVKLYNKGWHVEDLAQKTGLKKKFIEKLLREARTNAVVSD